MPGWELIDNKELKEISKIFSKSRGVLFAHGFNERRNNIFRVRDFEKKLCNKFNINNVLATTSGTMAQYLAMASMGIGPGDEVITQSFTFVATIETIIALGATPIIVDIDNSFNIDPIKLESVITKKTKLIIPVHMLGNPCEMNSIMQISKKYKIPVMEDACEAIGGQYKNKFLGTLGEVGFYSLDFGKTITTGEGGLITTNSKNLDKKFREFHDHGHELNINFSRGNDTRKNPGLNLRMTELQAAVGLAQLKKLDYILKMNRANKFRLKRQINHLDKIMYRKINDNKGELSDTLIFYFENSKLCKKFLMKYIELGYTTKNLPDAIKWHFSGTWNHMFKKIPKYKNNWKKNWSYTRKLLLRSISIPILVKSKNDYIDNHASEINKILKSL